MNHIWHVKVFYPAHYVWFKTDHLKSFAVFVWDSDHLQEPQWMCNFCRSLFKVSLLLYICRNIKDRYKLLYSTFT